MKKSVRIISLGLVLMLLSGCALAEPVQQNAISLMEGWPNLPSPYVNRDWNEYARKVTLLSFDGEADAKYFPITYYYTRQEPTSGGFTGLNFGTHTYLRQNNAMGGPGEAVTQLAAILTASMTEGLDPRDINGMDYVKMAQIYFMRTPDGRGFVSNNAPGSDCTGSFWYTLYPTLLYFHLAAQYPQDEALSAHIREVADTWLSALNNITTWDAMGYSLKNNQLVTGGHTEPEGIFGVAYIMLMAHARFGEEKYLNAAVALMERAAEFMENPYYEILGSYAPVIAARLNAEKNAGLPLERMMDWVFTDGTHLARPSWGIIDARWGDYDAYGLAGSHTDTNGYAFAMNTFVTAGALAPVARYAPEYAHDLGKYLTAVASNSHMFFADGLPLELQDDGDYVKETGLDFLVYEGVRHHKRDLPVVVPFATGDAKMFSPNIPGTTFSFYSSGPMGMFSSIVGETNVPEILCFDLLKTDFEHGAAYPTYLLYNPLNEAKDVIMPLPGEDRCDVWDAVGGAYLAKNVQGEAAFKMAADQAAMPVLLPVGAELTEKDGRTEANGVTVRYAGGWIDLPQTREYSMLRSGDEVKLQAHLPENDRVIGYSAALAGVEIAAGEADGKEFSFILRENVPSEGVLQVTVETALGKKLSCAKAVQVLSGKLQEAMHLEGKSLKKNFSRTSNCRVALEENGVRFKMDWGESIFSLPMQLIKADENPRMIFKISESSAAWGIKIFINQTAETHVLRSPAREEGEFLFDLGEFIRNAGFSQAHVKVQLVIREDSGKEVLLNEIALYTEGE